MSWTSTQTLTVVMDLDFNIRSVQTIMVVPKIIGSIFKFRKTVQFSKNLARSPWPMLSEFRSNNLSLHDLDYYWLWFCDGNTLFASRCNSRRPVSVWIRATPCIYHPSCEIFNHHEDNTRFSRQEVTWR